MTFGSTNLPVEQICVLSAVVDDPEDAYDEYEYDGKLVKIYDSQPMALADGEFVIDEIKVKISDFGAATFAEEKSESKAYGAISIAAPEILVGLRWNSRADIWSIGASVSTPSSPLMVRFSIY